ncbi:hypothetical protein PAXRUDRAFT_166468 [Paxillus rubicundulus Ve08.2h10]|uniref:CCHC-type domain-containing protein n=1 Tax=Paxillus rubicundulus Ve08.2h10 TaxID=930991 RepID=A0A0D0DAK6_9AGAM|nr:hypothetical protein PAXRUDRAFT_166468 [Paxillus rubicundulus Ve08.2h10]
MVEKGGQSTNQTAWSRKQHKKDSDVGINFIINAESHSGLMCQRKVFDVCFDNATADSDHCKCNSNNMQGCPQCHVMEPNICCDIHNHPAFLPYKSHISKPPRTAQRSHLPKYTKDKYDYKLEEALQDWQESKTTMVYGWASLNDYGPLLIMPNSTLDRIVDYAHHCKIQTPQDLKRETMWTDSNQFGNEVIVLIQRHGTPCPLLFASMPLRPSSVTMLMTKSIIGHATNVVTSPLLHLTSAPSTPSNNQLPPGPTKCCNKCGACGREGHNARDCVCPNHPSHGGIVDKENIGHLNMQNIYHNSELQ